MKSLRRQKSSLFLFLAALFFAQNSYAIPKFKVDNKNSAPTVLKADEVSGDQINNTLEAVGNVEINKGSSTIYANRVFYEKNSGVVRAVGKVMLKNLEAGNMIARDAEVRDDFSSGKFFDARMVFADGSYLTSPQIERKDPQVTVLKRPIYSICPNEEIGADNELAGQRRDFASIKSSQTTIDRTEGVMKNKHAIFRIYNVPLLYTPYFKSSLASKKRESGFLTPGYVRSSNLGFGVQIPYYFNIAPNKDLTTSLLYGVNSGQMILKNDFRHMTTYGDYQLKLEGANNKLSARNNTAVVVNNEKQYRWSLEGKGLFDFTTNTGLDFTMNTVGDRNYLRDYHFSYLPYTSSKVNLDYIHGRDYYAIKTIRIQELETKTAQNAAPWVLPSLDSHIESKPFFFKEKFALTSNATVIKRDSGLQYRRVSTTPEVNLPFNLKGNLFNLNAKVQGDFYSLDNNFQYGDARTNNFNHTQSNYKPEMSLSWKLPLINKMKSNTFLLEPMANFVSSSFKTTYDKLPNEDSNNSELTVSNLFTTDRIYGFDRNEVGERFNYGLRSSLFNRYGEFGFNIGQSYRKSSGTQDVLMRGFGDNSKSNVVGQAIYKAKKIFSIAYNFQLDESNYRNDVNQLNFGLSFDRVTFSADYLLLRRSKQNLQKRDQASFSSSVKLTDRWKVTIGASKDMVTNRMLSRKVELYRDGCCTVFTFSVAEVNPSVLTKSQKTFNLNLSFKNL